MCKTAGDPCHTAKAVQRKELTTVRKRSPLALAARRASAYYKWNYLVTFMLADVELPAAS